MFKWIALTVATCGLVALSYCFWPRTHVEGSRIVTPSGHVYTLGGDEVLDPDQAQFEAHARALMASDAVPFVPTPAKQGETEDEARWRRLGDVDPADASRGHGRSPCRRFRAPQGDRRDVPLDVAGWNGDSPDHRRPEHR